MLSVAIENLLTKNSFTGHWLYSNEVDTLSRITRNSNDPIFDLQNAIMNEKLLRALYVCFPKYDFCAAKYRKEE